MNYTIDIQIIKYLPAHGFIRVCYFTHMVHLELTSQLTYKSESVSPVRQRESEGAAEREPKCGRERTKVRQRESQSTGERAKVQQRESQGARIFWAVLVPLL